MDFRSPLSKHQDTSVPFHLEIIQEGSVNLFDLSPMVALTCTAPPDGDPVLSMTCPGSTEPLIIHQGEKAGIFYEWIVRARILNKSFLRIDTVSGRVSYWSQSEILDKKGILD